MLTYVKLRLSVPHEALTMINWVFFSCLTLTGALAIPPSTAYLDRRDLGVSCVADHVPWVNLPDALLASLWQWVIDMVVSKLYIMGELCGCGRVVWPWASCISLVSCVVVGELWAVGKLCGRGQAVWP